jgi:RNA polymerase subunit RPABC4/transcription elongation factor Spt4
MHIFPNLKSCIQNCNQRTSQRFKKRSTEYTQSRAMHACSVGSVLYTGHACMFGWFGLVLMVLHSDSSILARRVGLFLVFHKKLATS